MMDAALGSLILMGSMLIYNRSLTDEPTLQLLFFFLLGTVVQIARHPEGPPPAVVEKKRPQTRAERAEKLLLALQEKRRAKLQPMRRRVQVLYPRRRVCSGASRAAGQMVHPGQAGGGRGGPVEPAGAGARLADSGLR